MARLYVCDQYQTFSEHEVEMDVELDEISSALRLKVLGSSTGGVKSAAAVEPGDGAVDHPTPGLDDDTPFTLHRIAPRSTRSRAIGQDAGHSSSR